MQKLLRRNTLVEPVRPCLRLALGAISSLQPCCLAVAVALAITPAANSQTERGHQEEIHAHLRQAEEDLKSGNAPAAEKEFHAILALDPNNSEARAKLGFVLFMRGDWADAAEDFQQVLKDQPHLANAQAVLGMCQRRLGRPVEARKLLEEALPHLPAGALQTQAGLELAEILYQSDDLDRAVDVVRTLLSSNPKNVDVLYVAARVYADLANRSRDALALAAPESGRMHQLMAEFLINRGDAHAALIQYRKALELEPRLRGVHYELGEAIMQDSRQAPALEAAEKEFRAALADNPADARAEYRLGSVCSLRGDYRTAIQHYSRAIQLQPANAYAQQELGAAYIKMSEPEKAREYLLAATRLDPLYPSAHYQLGILYRQLGREADARRELETFEKLEEMRKEIDQVYHRTHPGFPESDLTGPSAPKN
jgi:tetratricopeptide (TPR) repeat protein